MTIKEPMLSVTDLVRRGRVCRETSKETFKGLQKFENGSVRNERSAESLCAKISYIRSEG